ncbi:MAG: hypothetical protein ACLVI9_01955 [Anaerostipes hadrus]
MTQRSINLSGQEPENQYDDTYDMDHMYWNHYTGDTDQVKIMTVRVFDDYRCLP